MNRTTVTGCYFCAGDRLPPQKGPRIDERHHIGNVTPRNKHLHVYFNGELETLAIQVYEGANGDGWVLRAFKDDGKLRRCACGSCDLAYEVAFGDVRVEDDGLI